MRLLIRIALALAVLAGLAVGALALLLPRLVASEALRERIGRAAREATGRDVSWTALELGVLPPRLVVSGAQVSGREAAAPPTLEGADVELRLALLPLLVRAVVVDSLRVEGATLRLARTSAGLELPRPAPEAGKPEAERAEPRGRFALAVRHVEVRHARLLLEDRSVSPAVTWELRSLDATLHGRSLRDPIDLEASAALASGGAFTLKGRGQQSGPFQLDLELDDVVLDPLQPYLAQGRRAAGRATGSVSARGKLPDPEQVVLELRLSDADVAVGDVTARGSLTLRADLAGGLARPQGSFALDATDAVLRYGNGFEKPRGTPASAEGRIVSEPDGTLGIDGTRVRIRNLDAKLGARGGRRARVSLAAEPFALDGWEELLPALRESPPTGRIGFEDFEIARDPLEVRGRVELEELRLRRATAEQVALSGALLGEGTTLRSRDLVAVAGGQTLPVELEISGLAAATPQARVRGQLEDADSNALLTALAGRRDQLSGPLDLVADLSAPLGGAAALTDALTGKIRLEIRPGRLRGVSLLRSALEGIGGLGAADAPAGRSQDGSNLKRFYDDEFEVLEGSFALGGGAARTDDLRIVYADYTVDLVGRVRMADLALDLSGTLGIDASVDAALAGAAEGAPAQAAPAGSKREIPLAEIGGTLSEPRVVIAPEIVLELAARYALGRRAEKLERKLDELLGEGAGQQVREALEGILGKRDEL